MPGIDALIQECRLLQMDDAQIIDNYTMEEIAQIYNGIGPEKFPDGLRRAITFLHPSFAAASLLHDLEYHRGGSPAQFRRSNWRLARNAAKSVKKRYNAWHILRYLLLFKALRFAWYCQIFGRSSWNAKKTAKESDFPV